VLCQFADRPFVGVPRDLRLAAAIFGCGNASLDQEVAHHLGIECVAPLGWPPAFSVEDRSDVSRVLTCAMQLARSRHKVIVGAELVQTGDGPD
jgi:hypothetical protein